MNRNGGDDDLAVTAATPLLDASKGHFLLGDLNADKEMYFFTFILGTTTVVPANEGDWLNFSYRLFGNEIATDPFSDTVQFATESATAKIKATADELLAFFSTSPEHSPFVIELVSRQENAVVGRSEVEWGRFLSKEKDAAERLRKGDWVVLEGIFPVEPIPRHGVRHGEVVVLLSLGRKRNLGLTSSTLTEEDAVTLPPTTKRNVTPLPTTSPPLASFGQVVEEMADDVDDVGCFSQVPSHPTRIRSIPTAVKRSINITQRRPFNGRSLLSQLNTDDAAAAAAAAATVSSYKFYIQLLSIGIATGGRAGSSGCRVEFDKTPFSFGTMDHVPDFEIQTSSDAKNLSFSKVDNFNHVIRFSATPTKLAQLSGRHVGLKVTVGGVNRGQVRIPLPSVTVGGGGRVVAQSKAPIVSTSRSVVGEVRYRASIVAGVSDDDSDPSSSELLQKRRKIDEELDRWKEAEKAKFRKQLQDIEKHHLQTLSTEWTGRQDEYKRQHDAKVEQLVRAENDCAELMAVYNDRNRQLSAKESQRETSRLLQEEEKVRLEKEISLLRQQVEELKRRCQSEADKSAALTLENCRLRERVSTLEGDRCQLREEIVRMKEVNTAVASAVPNDDSRGRGTLPENVAREIFLKTNLYSEDEYVVKKCSNPRTYSST